MTKSKLDFLCVKILEKSHGDSLRALDAIQKSVDSFFALGQWENAERMSRILAHFRAFYV